MELEQTTDHTRAKVGRDPQQFELGLVNVRDWLDGARDSRDLAVADADDVALGAEASGEEALWKEAVFGGVVKGAELDDLAQCGAGFGICHGHGELGLRRQVRFEERISGGCPCS